MIAMLVNYQHGNHFEIATFPLLTEAW